MSCPTNHRNIDPRRFDGGHSFCHDCKQHVEVVRAHYANGERPEVQDVRVLVLLDAEQPLPPHHFVPIAPEASPDGVLSAVIWNWCVHCGLLQLGNEYFAPRTVKATNGVLIGNHLLPPCVPHE